MTATGDIVFGVERSCAEANDAANISINRTWEGSAEVDRPRVLVNRSIEGNASIEAILEQRFQRRQLS